MIKTKEPQTIDVERVKRLSEELKGEGRQEDASAIGSLVTVVTQADKYYTSKEVADKFKVREDIVVAFVRKGTFKGIVVADTALLPKAQFAEFDRVEHLAREFDALVAQYTHEEIEEMIAEARREWISRGLF